MPLILVAHILLSAFVISFGLRAAYVHFFKFMPAARAFDAAHKASDRAGMNAAEKQRDKAHLKSFDPFWFLDSEAGGLVALCVVGRCICCGDDYCSRRNCAAMTHARRRTMRPPMDDAEYSARLREVALLHRTMPQEARDFFQRLLTEMCDLGENLQLPPKQMAVFATALIGGLCLSQTRGDVHADAEIDDFIDHCKIAIDVAVAEMRIRQGWEPEFKN